MSEIIITSIAAGVATAAFCVIFGVHGKNILVAAFIGAIGYLCGNLTKDFSNLFSVVFASAVIAFLSEIAARIKKAPTTIFLVGGLIPIVPGMAIYQGVFYAIEGDFNASSIMLVDAMLETGAIAVGIILVSSLIKLVPFGKIKWFRINK